MQKSCSICGEVANSSHNPRKKKWQQTTGNTWICDRPWIYECIFTRISGSRALFYISELVLLNIHIFQHACPHSLTRIRRNYKSFNPVSLFWVYTSSFSTDAWRPGGWGSSRQFGSCQHGMGTNLFGSNWTWTFIKWGSWRQLGSWQRGVGNNPGVGSTSDLGHGCWIPSKRRRIFTAIGVLEKWGGHQPGGLEYVGHGCWIPSKRGRIFLARWGGYQSVGLHYLWCQFSSLARGVRIFTTIGVLPARSWHETTFSARKQERDCQENHQRRLELSHDDDRLRAVTAKYTIQGSQVNESSHLHYLLSCGLMISRTMFHYCASSVRKKVELHISLYVL